MQFVLGVLATVAFFALLGGAYWLGKCGTRHVTPEQKKDDQEAREKAKKFKEGFNELMAYDMKKALGRKG